METRAQLTSDDLLIQLRGLGLQARQGIGPIRAALRCDGDIITISRPVLMGILFPLSVSPVDSHIPTVHTSRRDLKF
jgi:hypothetical protein